MTFTCLRVSLYEWLKIRTLILIYLGNFDLVDELKLSCLATRLLDSSLESRVTKYFLRGLDL